MAGRKLATSSELTKPKYQPQSNAEYEPLTDPNRTESEHTHVPGKVKKSVHSAPSRYGLFATGLCTGIVIVAAVLMMCGNFTFVRKENNACQGDLELLSEKGQTCAPIITSG